MTENATQTSINGGNDAFLIEMSPVGPESQFPFATYLGGSGDDSALGVALDSSGNIYVVGSTSSTDFLTLSNGLQGSNPGSASGFISQDTP